MSIREIIAMFAQARRQSATLARTVDCLTLPRPVRDPYIGTRKDAREESFAVRRTVRAIEEAASRIRGCGAPGPATGELNALIGMCIDIRGTLDMLVDETERTRFKPKARRLKALELIVQLEWELEDGCLDAERAAAILEPTPACHQRIPACELRACSWEGAAA